MSLSTKELIEYVFPSNTGAYSDYWELISRITWSEWWEVLQTTAHWHTVYQYDGPYQNITPFHLLMNAIKLNLGDAVKSTIYINKMRVLIESKVDLPWYREISSTVTPVHSPNLSGITPLAIISSALPNKEISQLIKLLITQKIKLPWGLPDAYGSTPLYKFFANFDWSIHHEILSNMLNDVNEIGLGHQSISQLDQGSCPLHRLSKKIRTIPKSEIYYNILRDIIKIPTAYWLKKNAEGKTPFYYFIESVVFHMKESKSAFPVEIVNIFNEYLTLHKNAIEIGEFFTIEINEVINMPMANDGKLKAGVSFLFSYHCAINFNNQSNPHAKQILESRLKSFADCAVRENLVAIPQIMKNYFKNDPIEQAVWEAHGKVGNPESNQFLIDRIRNLEQNNIQHLTQIKKLENENADLKRSYQESQKELEGLKKSQGSLLDVQNVGVQQNAMVIHSNNEFANTLNNPSSDEINNASQDERKKHKFNYDS